MGVSCSKPSRANSPGAVRFVEYLLKLEQVIQQIEADPNVVSDLNAQSEREPTQLHRNFQYDAKHGVKLELSSVRLRREFGAVAQRIWKKLFIRVAQGGWSELFDRKFDSIWAVNRHARLQISLALTKGDFCTKLSPQDYLRLLVNIEPMLVSHTYTRLSFDGEGFSVLRKGPKRLIGESTRQKVLHRQRALKDQARQLDDENQRLVDARQKVMAEAESERET